MKLYLTFLALVLFIACLNIIAVAKSKKYLIVTEDEDVSMDEPTADTLNKIKDPASVKVIAEENAAFGQKMYKKLKEEDESNLLMSPYSVHSVMAMLQVGARNKTREQIRWQMPFPNMKFLLSGYRDVSRLTKGDKNFTLKSANKLFVQENVIEKDFVREVKENFHAEVTLTDFAEKGGKISRKLINDWVEEKTNKTIKDLIPEDMLDSSTRIVLANAIYFKGNWSSKFDRNETQEEDFYVEEGKTVKVQMMRKIMADFNMTYFQQLNSKVIELPYKGNRVSMYIILPTDKFGLEEVEMSLYNMNILDIFEEVDGKAKKLTIALPKFKLEKTIDLSEILKKLGMKQMFTDMADFSGISKLNILKVSDAIQKAFIEVNEEGSEAAAASVLGVNTFSMPTEFLCNHPFIFFIRDKLTNMVLFSGRVVDPTVG